LANDAHGSVVWMAFAIRRRLQFAGLPMVVLPVRVLE
jgi:hypothetical protein